MMFNPMTNSSRLVGTTLPVGEADADRAIPVPRAGIGLDILALGDDRMLLVVDKVARVLETSIPVLIEGEAGTGKERLAMAIHHNGPRRHGPFVVVNCVAVAKDMVKSNLFGFDGRFPAANHMNSIWGIQQARGGTLFLDEIGGMPTSVQAHLLPLLRERSVAPVDGSHSLNKDMAIVCATTRKIRELVERGEFREDLYYRLNGLTVMLPPLRERSDLKPMVRKLVDLENRRGFPVEISAEVLDIFARHPWPGNIRQLHNVIRTGLALLGDDVTLTRDCLPDDILDDIDHASGQSHARPTTSSAARTQEIAAPMGGDSLQDIAAQAIRLAIESHQGNLSAAARQLGVSRNTLYRKLRKSPELWIRK